MWCWTVHLDGTLQRVNHAAVAIGSSIFSFGGYCTTINYKRFDSMDIHIFDTVKLTWGKLNKKFTENAPFHRYGHTVVAYGTKIYLWGGRNDLIVCSVLYCFDTKTLEWSTPRVSGTKPLGRDGHSACIVGDCMYIYGGYQEYPRQFSEDLYMLNLNTMEWSLEETEGDPPLYRDFHSATAIGEKMYVFGGRGDIAGFRYTDREIYCDKVYCYDTVTGKWNCPPVSGQKPSGRRSHSAFEYRGKLYIFGGFNRITGSFFQDIHQYDPESCTWKIIIPKGTPPSSRRRQICVIIDNKVFISGGSSQISTDKMNSSELQNYTLEDKIRFLKYNDDIHVLDLDPNLKDMCLVNIWDGIQKMQIDIQNIFLPSILKNELEAARPLKEDESGQT